MEILACQLNGLSQPSVVHLSLIKYTAIFVRNISLYLHTLNHNINSRGSVPRRDENSIIFW